MQLSLTKPELEKFITAKVTAGDFASPEAVVEDALVRMMQEECALTDADVEALNEAESQIDRGEFVELDEFAAKMRQKYSTK